MIRKTLGAVVLAAMALGAGGCGDANTTELQAKCQVNGLTTELWYHQVPFGDDRRFIKVYRNGEEVIRSGEFEVYRNIGIKCDNGQVIFVKNSILYVRPPEKAEKEEEQ